MKGRKKRATGGVNEAAEDMNTKSMSYTADSNVEKEAKERKRGGRAKRKRGGLVPGEMAKCHAGRKPRKSGGRATSDNNPYTSARAGKQPKGRSVETEME